MSAQWDYEVVDAIRSVISSQNYCFVLPLVFFGVAVAAVLADLSELNGLTDGCQNHAGKAAKCVRWVNFSWKFWFATQ